MSVELWTEKYRPRRFADYVWRDPLLRAKSEQWIKDGALPHLILSGKSGLGKTALIQMLLSELKVPKADIMVINASGNRKIDEIQERIMGFISTYPMWDNEHEIKYVVFEEADSMSLLAQKFLRAELERNVNNVRFLFTCNYPEKIEPAIIGRCQQFHFEALNQEEFVVRLMQILDAEGVAFEIDTLTDYIDHAYPDLRKCIGMIQQGTINGALNPRREGEGRSFDYLLEVSELFRNGKHKLAREMIVAQAGIEEYPEIFRFLYQNLHFWGDDPAQQDAALILIRDGLFKHGLIADPEINLSAVIVELTRLRAT